jgi:hypothetical protein
MPNWAYTEYWIEGSKEQISKLDNAIEYIKSLPKPYVDNGFGNLWLGCLINYLGGDWHTINCRGELLFVEKRSDTLMKLNTETAWWESYDFRQFLLDTFPGMKIYYFCEEDGMREYETNDTEGVYFPYRYIIDIDDVDKHALEHEYFITLDDVKERLKDIGYEGFGETLDDIQSYFEEYEEENEDAYIFVGKIGINSQP